MAQEGDAGGVDVHADMVHAGIDHFFERFGEVFCLDVVLIQSDAKVCRRDFYQFGERVE